jgi:hypothetical protein
MGNWTDTEGKQKSISVRIFKAAEDKDSFLDPIEKTWQELKHCKNTIIFLKNMLKLFPQSPHRLTWHQELLTESKNFKDTQACFKKYYLGCLCLLQEFEINKYDREYYELSISKL